MASGEMKGGQGRLGLLHGEVCRGGSGGRGGRDRLGVVVGVMQRVSVEEDRSHGGE